MTETLLIHFSKEDIILALEDYYKKQNISNKVVDFKFDSQEHLKYLVGEGISVKALFYEKDKLIAKEIETNTPQISIPSNNPFITYTGYNTSTAQLNENILPTTITTTN